MAKDVAILSNTVSAGDTKQMVLNQSYVERPLPFAVTNALFLIRFSITGTQSIPAGGFQMGFGATSKNSLMDIVNGASTSDSHFWRIYNQGATSNYTSGTPDYWVGSTNFYAERYQSGSGTLVTFQSAGTSRWATGDDTRQVIGVRILSDGPTDATTYLWPVFRQAASTADVDDGEWTEFIEGQIPSPYVNSLAATQARDDTTHGTLDCVWVQFQNPSVTTTDLKIHDMAVINFT